MPGVGVVEDAAPGVGRGDVGLQRGATDLVGHRGQRGPGRGHVDTDDGGAVAGEGPGDLGADAAGGTGDDGDLADQRAVVGGREGLARTDPHHLRVDVGRPRGEQELDGAQRRGLGAVGDEHEVGGRPGAQLLGDRAGDALERPAGGPLGGRAGQRGVAADDDDPGAAPEPLQRRAEGGAQGLEVGGVLGGGEVDDDRAEPPGLGQLVDEGGTGRGQAVTQGGQRGGVGVAADEHRAVDERAPGHLPAQRHRLGQAEGGGQLLAQPRGDECRVAVAVRHLRPPRGSRPRPGHRPRRSTPARASPAPCRGAAWRGWRRCARRSPRTGARRRATSR